MASSFSNSGLELMVQGEQVELWGDITSDNLLMLEESVNGVVSLALTTTAYTLITPDGETGDTFALAGRHQVLVFTGSPGGTCTVTISPADLQKVYFIDNMTDQSVIIKQGTAGSTVTIPSGEKSIVYCDGAGATDGAVTKLTNFKTDTSTTLHALGSGSAGSVYLTFGLSSIGDGGGGKWYWDSTADKSTANLGTIIDPDKELTFALQGTGAGTGCWVRAYDTERIEAIWFGADNVAVQAAVDTLPVGGQLILTGLYTFSSSVNIAQTIRITGSSSLKTKITTSGDISAFIIDSALREADRCVLEHFYIEHSAVTKYAIQINAAPFVQLTDLYIDCNESGFGGIWLDDDTIPTSLEVAHLSTISNCQIIDYTNRGVYIHSTGRLYYLIDCYVNSVIVGVDAVYCNDSVKVSRGQFQSAGGSSLHYYNDSLSDAKGNIVEGLTFGHNNAGGSHILVDGSTNGWEGGNITDIQCDFGAGMDGTLINLENAKNFIISNLKVNRVTTETGILAKFGENTKNCVIYTNFEDSKGTMIVHANAVGALKYVIDRIPDMISFNEITTYANLTTIIQGGLDVLPYGFTPVHNGAEWNFAILDISVDAAESVIPPTYMGVCAIMDDRQIAAYGKFAYDTVAPDIETHTGGNDLEIATGILTGTTGTIDKITVSTHTDGKIYIENRKSIPQHITLLFESAVYGVGNGEPIFSGTILDMIAGTGVAMTPFDASVYFASGGTPTSYSLQNEPVWMSIDNTGLITGTPGAAVTTSGITVTATNSKNSAISNTFNTTVIEETFSTAKLTVANGFMLLGDLPGGSGLTAIDTTGATVVPVADFVAACQYAYDNDLVSYMQADEVILLEEQLELKDLSDQGIWLHNTFALVGSKAAGAKPVIKLKDNSAAFQSGSTDFIKLTHWDSGAETPDTMYGWVFRGIDIDLGTGNPAANGLYMHGAQDCVLRDVHVYGTGFRAGFTAVIRTSINMNLNVTNGSYGLNCEYVSLGAGFVGLTLHGQTVSCIDNKIAHSGNITGFDIKPAVGATAIKTNSGGAVRHNYTLQDGTIELASADTAIDNTNAQAFAMKNVYFKNASTIIDNTGTTDDITGNSSGWIRVDDYSYNPPSPTADATHGYNLIDGVRSQGHHSTLSGSGVTPPSDTMSRHVWLGNRAYESSFVEWITDHGAVAGSESTAHIEAAIAAAELSGKNSVFVPLGAFMVSGPTTLRKDTQMFGLSGLRGQLKADKGVWNPTTEEWMVQTVDDATATCSIAHVVLDPDYAAGGNSWISSLLWRAGRNSIVAYTRDNLSNSAWIDTARRLILIENNGGGRWYNCQNHSPDHWQSEYPDDFNNEFRKLTIQNTTEPLTFYLLDQSWGNISSKPNEYMPSVSILNANNVRILGSKAEFHAIWMEIKNSDNIFLSSLYGKRYWEDYDYITMEGNTNVQGSMLFWDNAATPTTYEQVKEIGYGTPDIVTKEDFLGLYRRGNLDWTAWD